MGIFGSNDDKIKEYEKKKLEESEKELQKAKKELENKKRERESKASVSNWWDKVDAIPNTPEINSKLDHSNENLSFQSFEGVDLTDTNYKNTNLKNTNFTNTNLTNCDFVLFRNLGNSQDKEGLTEKIIDLQGGWSKLHEYLQNKFNQK